MGRIWAMWDRGNLTAVEEAVLGCGVFAALVVLALVMFS